MKNKLEAIKMCLQFTALQLMGTLSILYELQENIGGNNALGPFFSLLNSRGDLHESSGNFFNI